jgi:hypothetical protein
VAEAKNSWLGISQNHCASVGFWSPKRALHFLMKLPMMSAAEWNSELVADFNAIGLARADLSGIEVSSQRMDLLC